MKTNKLLTLNKDAKLGYVYNQEYRNAERNEGGTWGIGEYYISGNVAKHSGEYHQMFRGMSPNIPGNVAKHSGECLLLLLLLTVSYYF